MLVMLDEPKNEKWGSEAAAPIFAAIGRDALRYLNVPPRDTTPVPIVRGEVATARAAAPTGISLADVRPASLELVESAEPVMPRLQGLSLRQAMAMLAPFEVELEISGRGVVEAQTPAAGAPLAPGSVCRLTLASPIATPRVSP
jgi:hypothetical protein